MALVQKEAKTKIKAAEEKQALVGKLEEENKMLKVAAEVEKMRSLS